MNHPFLILAGLLLYGWWMWRALVAEGALQTPSAPTINGNQHTPNAEFSADDLRARVKELQAPTIVYETTYTESEFIAAVEAEALKCDK